MCNGPADTVPAATAATLSCVHTASVRSCGSRQARPACVRPVLVSAMPASEQPVDCAGESLPAVPAAATQPARTAGSSCSSSTAPVALRTWAPWSGPLELPAAGVRRPCACRATSGGLGRVRMLCASSCVSGPAVHCMHSLQSCQLAGCPHVRRLRHMTHTHTALPCLSAQMRARATPLCALALLTPAAPAVLLAALSPASPPEGTSAASAT